VRSSGSDTEAIRSVLWLISILPTCLRLRAAPDAWRGAGAIVEEVEVGLTKRADVMWAELRGVYMAAYFGHFLDEFADRMDPDVVSLINLGNNLSAVQLKRLDIRTHRGMAQDCRRVGDP
jgi:Asp-tRNA(Asn)/Glu-tRNA(Gln) amidotransferase A subunit family amidase